MWLGEAGLKIPKGVNNKKKKLGNTDIGGWPWLKAKKYQELGKTREVTPRGLEI